MTAYNYFFDKHKFHETSVYAWFHQHTDLRNLHPAECQVEDQWYVETDRGKTVALAISKPNGHIQRLAVIEEHQGNGLGRKLIENMLERYGEIELECRESLDANDFYEYIGMELIETRLGEPEDLLVWRLSK